MKLDAKLDSGNIPGRQSYSGSASNDLTIHRSDCKIYKYISISPNQLHLAATHKCLQPLYCCLTGSEVRWRATGCPNQLWLK